MYLQQQNEMFFDDMSFVLNSHVHFNPEDPPKCQISTEAKHDYNEFSKSNVDRPI
jgi:hypothetical protein